MSPLNVHVNRYPLDGTVKYAAYHLRKYLVAWHPKSSTLNERTSIVVENNNIAVLFRQIVELLLVESSCIRRSMIRPSKDKIFGFIKFGSRVDLFFPVGTDIHVQIDQIVKGNKTIIASY